MFSVEKYKKQSMEWVPSSFQADSASLFSSLGKKGSWELRFDQFISLSQLTKILLHFDKPFKSKKKNCFLQFQKMNQVLSQSKVNNFNKIAKIAAFAMTEGRKYSLDLYQFAPIQNLIRVKNLELKEILEGLVPILQGIIEANPEIGAIGLFFVGAVSLFKTFASQVDPSQETEEKKFVIRKVQNARNHILAYLKVFSSQTIDSKFRYQGLQQIEKLRLDLLDAIKNEKNLSFSSTEMLGFGYVYYLIERYQTQFNFYQTWTQLKNKEITQEDARNNILKYCKDKEKDLQEIKERLKFYIGKGIQIDDSKTFRTIKILGTSIRLTDFTGLVENENFSDYIHDQAYRCAVSGQTIEYMFSMQAWQNFLKNQKIPLSSYKFSLMEPQTMELGLKEYSKSVFQRSQPGHYINWLGEVSQQNFPFAFFVNQTNGSGKACPNFRKLLDKPTDYYKMPAGIDPNAYAFVRDRYLTQVRHLTFLRQMAINFQKARYLYYSIENERVALYVVSNDLSQERIPISDSSFYQKTINQKDNFSWSAQIPQYNVVSSVKFNNFYYMEITSQIDTSKFKTLTGSINNELDTRFYVNFTSYNWHTDTKYFTFQKQKPQDNPEAHLIFTHVNVTQGTWGKLPCTFTCRISTYNDPKLYMARDWVGSDMGYLNARMVSEDLATVHLISHAAQGLSKITAKMQIGNGFLYTYQKTFSYDLRWDPFRQEEGISYLYVSIDGESFGKEQKAAK